eukprot:TRINITY_DN180_c0_g1_i6.p1 TRINITY_DN180_c0_g1~~TRINITY_DN180_c0_g1_i6.p1  ORF type:complete len:1582 (+),score=504.79 TRINITY_DN180_c0_g1_i6:156-4901(+)
MSVTSVGSSGGSGSVASGFSQGSGDSTSTAGASVCGLLLEEQTSSVERLKSRLLLLFVYLGNRPITPIIAMMSAVTEVGQLSTFTYSGPQARGFGAADGAYFSALDYVRAFGAGRVSYDTTLVVLWLILAVLLIMVAVCARVVVLVHRGEETWGRLATVAKYFIAIMPQTVYVPIMSYVLVFLNCQSSGALTRFPEATCTGAIGAVGLTVAAVVAAIAVPAAFLCSALGYACFPSGKEYMSMVDGRFRVLMFASNTVMVVMNEIATTTPSHIMTLVYGAVTILIWAVLEIWLLSFLPFHKPVTMWVYSSICFGCFWGAILRYTMANQSEDSLQIFYIWVGGVPFALLLGALIAFVRIRTLSKKNLGAVGAKFDLEIDVEISTRFALYTTDEHVVDAAMGVYVAGLQAFPHSVSVRLAQCVFMATHFEDHRMLHIYLQRIRRLHPSFEHLFLLCRIDWRRRCLVREQDDGEEEIAQRLARAAKYENECRRWLRAFWRHLANGDELAQLPDIVSSLERNERLAEEIYRKVLIQFPKKTRPLRAYGIFLEEVKNDFEAGQVCFRTADEIEKDRERQKRQKAITRDAKKDMKKSSSKSVGRKKTESSAKSSENTVLHAVKTTGSKTGNTPETNVDTVSDTAEGGQAVSKRTRFDLADSETDDSAYEFYEMDQQPSLDSFSGKDSDWAVADILRRDQEAADQGPPALLLDTKSDPRLHANHRQRRTEMRRIRNYSRKIEQSRSGALRALSLAIRITLLVLFLDVLVVFISSKTMFDDFSRSIDVLSKAGQLTTYVHQAAFLSRRMDLGAHIKNSTMYDRNRNALYARGLGLKQLLEDLRNDDYSQSVNNVWDVPNYSRKVFIEPSFAGDSGTFIQQPDTLFNIAQRAVSASLFTSAVPFESAANISSTAQFRALLDNFDVLQQGFEEVRVIYNDNAVQAKQLLETILFVLLPLSVALLLVLTLAIFRPTTRKLGQERGEALKLFTAVPKATIAQIRERISGRKSSEEITDHEEELQEEMAAIDDNEMSSTGAPVLQTLTARYFTILGIACVLVGVCFFLGLYFVTTMQHQGPEIIQSWRRRALAKRAQFLAEETAFTDAYTWPAGLQQIRSHLNDSIAELTDCHNALKFGNVLGLPSLSGNAEQNRLLYTEPCYSYSAALRPTCFGMEPMMQSFLSAATQQLLLNATLLRPPSDDTASNLPYLHVLLTLLGEDFHDDVNRLRLNESDLGTFGELSTFLRWSAELFYDAAVQKMANIDSGMLAVFLLCLPLLIGAYFFLTPLETRIREENVRTMKMLLMVPLDVVDSVPALLEFLDTGRQENAQQKLKDAFDEFVTRTESILDAAVDGIISMDEQKLITMVNPAAEAIFGYTEAELVGKNVKMLCPPGVAELHDAYVERYLSTKEARLVGRVVEQCGRRKDGSEVPLQMTVSVNTVNAKINFVAFLRDVTLQKQNERLLKREKEKSEKLLLSLLPAVIAEQLKEDGIDGSKHLVAEAYKEVTVLFADIVNFTTMSSQITPSELVFILNQLFSEWDLLCEKHGIEKIKTIGDCYMAAAGVPRRCVVRNVFHTSTRFEAFLSLLHGNML